MALPLVVWLVLTTTGAAGLLWIEGKSRDGLVQRFDLRVGLASEFITSYVADLIDRQRVQATVFLTDPVVSGRDFTRSVSGFGYSAAVLLDARGTLLHVAPADASLIGRDLTGRYPHLRTAVSEARPAVSPVVPSAVRGVPVVAFAVPFDTRAGRRVFSGAVEIARSPLSSYLATAIPLSGVKVFLVDAADTIVAANAGHDPNLVKLGTREADLAAALGRGGQGRYRHEGHWWRYSSRPIPGTPWRLSATVAEDVLFAPVASNEAGGRAAVGAAAGVGLLVVAVAGRARRNRRELQLSEERFRKVFDESRVGMTLTDPDGRLLRVNPALCEMLGYAEPDLLGRHLIDPDGTAAGVAGPPDGPAGRADGFDVDKHYVHADGHVVEASVTTVLLRDDAGRPQHFATQIIDVTERRTLERARERHEAELAARAAELQHANVQMGDFIAMLSHDVRQPMTNVVAYGELLLDDWAGFDDADKLRYVQRMTAGGHRADHLVNEILTLAQLDAGAMTARPVRMDVHHAVREAVTALGLAPDYPITVTAPDEIIAFADPAHLQLILGNLLGNAVKYGTPPVHVVVSPDRDSVQIRVSDHGEGVPEEFIPHLFDRFTRADTGVASVKPGTGLGLYLVRQLAAADGLIVGYQPHQPRGATFTLSLPVSPSRIATAVEAPVTAHHP